MNPLNYYSEAKERHPGMLLMFRVGDWYEMVGDDAETCVRLLGLTLAVNAPDGTLIARFAHQWLESYLRKLLHAGHRVAICDQIEPTALPKRVEVNRIVTPGTIQNEVPEPETLFDWMVE
jgi:DNA mismatch repair protein MutS